jgi:hypothetical protein
LPNEELHILYSSPNVIRMVMSRRMRWVEHVANIWEKNDAYRFLWESLKKETSRKA